MRTLPRRVTALLLLALLPAGCGSDDHAPTASTPNILFIIMDDVGIDQMQVFGYGGDTPPSTPNIARIADSGIRFHNTWAMPACTTSRAVFFDARWPLRTNVKGALGPNDLANSMVSPYEMTTPKLLAQKGYESGLFGKFHLGLQEHDPAGYAMPYNLGWNYFAGWLDQTGDPSSIDTSAGGVADTGTWSCGYVAGASVPGGADFGACYKADGSCRELTGRGEVPPGRICRDDGGILDPNAACQTRPSNINFTTLSGHYVSPLVYNFPDGTVQRIPPVDPRARTFRATVAVDEAIAWINDRPNDRPWMATVSFASDHTPLMQPPIDEAQSGNAESSNRDCSNPLVQRQISNLMIESLDTEVGRLLVETGLAERGRGLVYRPDRTDTMVIVVGDNGSLGTTVKEPFSISRAKGTAYQTGVWVPLVIAGPLVRQPHRVVDHMVNIADLYALFGEIAGFENVQQEVPRLIDAAPLLPYVVNPNQGSIRRWNYTEVGANLQVGGAINGPCTISNSCTQIPVSKSVCEDNNGVWWGPGIDLDTPLTEGASPDGYTYCCQVNQFVVANDRVDMPYTMQPLVSVGIRNDRYKIVENSLNDYISQEVPCRQRTETEFYEINEDVPDPMLDDEGTNLPIHALDPEQQRNYDELEQQLAAIRASVPDCPGDGNIDDVVNDVDLTDWQFYSSPPYGQSSVYDFNIDGLTNDLDRAVIELHLGAECR